MPSSHQRRRVLTALVVAVAVSVTTAGCVSMPSGGPVLSYTVTQGTSAQNQPFLQYIPPSPEPGEGPSDIVQGFLAASASFVGQQQVASEYLTPAAIKTWHLSGSATVFSGSGPAIKSPPVTAEQGTATVTVSGDVEATLSNFGEYAVASAKPQSQAYHFDLVRYGGQWRISKMSNSTLLLLTRTEFAADYQLRNLYFFDLDPSEQYLVPDPVYVPLEATQSTLLKGLVQDLIRPPGDWLGQGGATRTAFPADTTLQAVTVDGPTALVNLSLPAAAASRVSNTVKAEVSAQLWYTLSVASQGQQGQVQSIALSINGHPYVPRGASPDNPVQSNAGRYAPANGPQARGFYYLTKTGQLMMQAPTTTKPSRLSVIGQGYTALAISPDGQYVAALRGGDVYTGMVGVRRLTPRNVTGVTSLSWDRNDYLWAADGSAIVVMLATANKQASAPTQVSVTPSPPACGNNQDVTAIRVAPDGVRVAIVYGGQELAFGAIVQPGAPAQQFTVRLSQFSVCGTSSGTFTSLSWYGANNVVALGEPGDTLTEYPVNGGTSTTIPGPGGPGIRSISASGNPKGGGLIVGLSHGAMSIDSTSTGAWHPPFAGLSPTFPG